MWGSSVAMYLFEYQPWGLVLKNIKKDTVMYVGHEKTAHVVVHVTIKDRNQQ